MFILLELNEQKETEEEEEEQQEQEQKLQLKEEGERTIMTKTIYTYDNFLSVLSFSMSISESFSASIAVIGTCTNKTFLIIVNIII